MTIKLIKHKIHNKKIYLLFRTTASTWGAIFASARQIYSAVVRPALAYGAAIWHSPQLGRQRSKRALLRGPIARMASVQNKCL